MRLLSHLLFIVAVVLLADGSSAAVSGTRRSGVPDGWRAVSSAPPAQPHRFFLALPQRRAEELLSALLEVSDPHHARYQQYWTAQQVRDFVSPPPEVKAAVHDWLLQDPAVSPAAIKDHGDALEVTVPVAAVSRLFNTSMTVYRHSSGRQHVAASAPLSLPEHVAQHLDMILGVVDFPFRIHHPSSPLSRRAAAVSPAPSPAASSSHRFRTSAALATTKYTVMAPADLAAYYGFPDETQFPRPARYLANTSIAVAQFDNTNAHGQVQYASFQPTDITAQGVLSGLAGIQSSPTLWGDNGDSSNPSMEASLDIQMVTANDAATEAWFWEETADLWVYGLTHSLLGQTAPPQVVSISYGSTEQICSGNECPDGLSGGDSVYLNKTDINLQKLGMMGVSVLSASGDNGASGSGNPSCKYSKGGVNLLRGISRVLSLRHSSWCHGLQQRDRQHGRERHELVRADRRGRRGAGLRLHRPARALGVAMHHVGPQRWRRQAASARAAASARSSRSRAGRALQWPVTSRSTAHCPSPPPATSTRAIGLCRTWPCTATASAWWWPVT